VQILTPEALLRQGSRVDIFARNARGQNAYDCALEYNHAELAAYLKEKHPQFAHAHAPPDAAQADTHAAQAAAAVPPDAAQSVQQAAAADAPEHSVISDARDDVTDLPVTPRKELDAEASGSGVNVSPVPDLPLTPPAKSLRPSVAGGKSAVTQGGNGGVEIEEELELPPPDRPPVDMKTSL
jgi:hypothetical protein